MAETQSKQAPPTQEQIAEARAAFLAAVEAEVNAEIAAGKANGAHISLKQAHNEATRKTNEAKAAWMKLLKG